MSKKVGRPKKLDPNRKRVTVEQAVQITKEFWAKFGRPGYSRGHIYNMISKGELDRTGPKSCALLYEDEIIEKLCG